MIRIVVTDDHPMLRAGLVQTLNREGDFKVVDEFGSGEELLNKFDADNYDVLLLDIDLPGRDGIETLKEIKKNNSTFPIIILSAYSEDRYGVRAIHAGANAYLSKEEEKSIIADAIRKVKGGKKYITPKLAEVLANELDKTYDKPLHEKLSDREFEIFKHIALGKPVSGIADELSLSVNTVNTYRARILEKMGLKSNTQIALYALENGLLSK